MPDVFTIPSAQDIFDPSGYDGYWLGRMGATLGYADEYIGQGDYAAARRLLGATLREFVASPVPSQELRDTLKGLIR